MEAKKNIKLIRVTIISGKEDFVNRTPVLREISNYATSRIDNEGYSHFNMTMLGKVRGHSDYFIVEEK